MRRHEAAKLRQVDDIEVLAQALGDTLPDGDRRFGLELVEPVVILTSHPSRAAMSVVPQEWCAHLRDPAATGQVRCPHRCARRSSPGYPTRPSRPVVSRQSQLCPLTIFTMSSRYRHKLLLRPSRSWRELCPVQSPHLPRDFEGLMEGLESEHGELLDDILGGGESLRCQLSTIAMK